MARAWVEDLWKTADGSPSARAGEGARWRVRWWEEQVQADGSLTRKQRARSFRKKPDAEAFSTKVEHEQRAGTYRPPERAETPFAEVAAEWLKAHLDVKAATFRRYDRELRMYVLPRFGTTPIGRVTRAQVSDWVADLARGDAKARYITRGSGEMGDIGPMRKPLGAASIQHLHTVLVAVLGWAVETDRIAANPATRVRLPRIVDPEQVYLSHEQIEALGNAAEDVATPADRSLVLLLAYTGLRINEALALTIADVDIKQRRIGVSQTWTEDLDGKRVLGPPKTHERRKVPLPAFLALDLAGLIKDRASTAWLFESPRGGHVHDNNWRARVWRYAVHDAGLDGMGLTPHKLRHTAASAAIAAGADVKVVQLMLGHKDATETLNRYGHLWPDRLDEVAGALELARESALAAERQRREMGVLVG